MVAILEKSKISQWTAIPCQTLICFHFHLTKVLWFVFYNIVFQELEKITNLIQHMMNLPQHVLIFVIKWRCFFWDYNVFEESWMDGKKWSLQRLRET